MNSASEASARAIAMRWRWPPENSCGNFSAVGGMEADQAEQLADARLDVALALDQVEGADRLGDDGIDAPARVEARVRVLEDHLDAAAQLSPRRRLARSVIEMPSIMTSPEVGGSRPTTIRATVDLPEPDSPTSAKVSPLADVEASRRRPP